MWLRSSRLKVYQTNTQTVPCTILKKPVSDVADPHLYISDVRKLLPLWQTFQPMENSPEQVSEHNNVSRTCIGDNFRGPRTLRIGGLNVPYALASLHFHHLAFFDRVRVLMAVPGSRYPQPQAVEADFRH